MDEIKVFGPMPGCIKCKKTLEVAEKVASDLGITAKKYDIFSDEAEELGILMSPTVVFREEVVSSGQMMTYDKMKGRIEDIISKNKK